MLIDNLEVLHIKKCFLVSKNAEPIPPLGTILGNLGINTIKFCEEFNIYTKNLPNYFVLKVVIYILDNRSFKFKIHFSSTSFIINLLKFEKTIKVRVYDRLHDKVVVCILLKDLIQLALFKFPKYDLVKSIPII
jgi:ribosomal protein L11